jgi:hypothetical protein
MTTKTAAHSTEDAEAPQTRVGFTHKLSRVISDGERTWNEITVTPPTLGHHIAADQKPEGMAQVVHLYSLLTGIPEEAIRRIKTVDSRAIQKFIDARAVDAPAPAPIEDNGDGVVIDLLHPISAGGRPLKSITLREPDLEAGIAVEKVKGGPHQGTAASIAVLSGLTIPVVSKLSMLDVKRIEAWMLPFLTDTDQMEDGEI